MTFKSADILVAKTENLTSWSVVACDQYTSEPAYWKQVENLTKNEISSYHLILPEIYLEEDDVDERIKKVNDTMISYCRDNVFTEYNNAYFYIERIQRNGKIRRGIVGAVDLEDYEYTKGSKSAVRATEGTVIERIPPRLKVRRNAKLELPHVMLLVDDRKKCIIEEIAKHTDKFEKVYDFDLMQNSGHITGWLINSEYSAYLETSLDELSSLSAFNEKYGVCEPSPLVYAVGDGNHSLATAKEYYNEMKTAGKADDSSPARYALAELVNLHDDSLVFEAIHRVMFDIDEDKFESELSDMCIESNEGQSFVLVTSKGEKTLSFKNPTANLTVGSMQNFIDSFIKQNGGRVDYIHGDDVVRELSSKPNTCGIILNAMDKNDLFKTVIIDGALPRKTFSMGDACDKRFYNEARIINNNI